MMNVIVNIFGTLMEPMLKVINVLVNAVETVGIAAGLTAHESHMLLVIAIGVSLGIQSAKSLERMRAREHDVEEAIDGMFNCITNKLFSNKKAAKTAVN